MDDAGRTRPSARDQQGISGAPCRHKWRRQTDNQGRVRVLVPIDALADADVRQTDRAATSADIMFAAVTALREANAGLVVRAERTEAEADRQRERADALGNRVIVLQADAEEARRDAQVAQDKAEAIARAEAAAQQVRGLLARLRAALRRE